MLTNRFVKSCRSERVPFGLRMPCKITQFFARGTPFDVRSAELEFLVHQSKPCATSKTLEALQKIRTDVNRLFRFFQHVFFVESNVCTLALKAVEKRSEFVLIIDTNKFISDPSDPSGPSDGPNVPSVHTYFFWSMVLGPLLYFTAGQPLRGFEVGSVQSAVRDLTVAWRSDVSRSE